MTRSELLERLIRQVEAIRSSHPVRPVRVGIDGVDAAGKTTLADELGASLQALGRPVVRAGVDDFHHPKAHRYRLGRQSPEGYFHDSFDVARLRESLLDPLGPGGDRRYRRRAFDYRRDATVEAPIELAAPDGLLVFDGIFLQRPELRDCFELTIFLQVPFEVTVSRMVERDGGPHGVDHPGNRRYVEGQRIYLRECRPADRADIVIDNADPSAPRFLRGPGRGAG